MFQEIERFFRRQQAPVTAGVLIAMGAAFIVGHLLPRAALAAALVSPGPGIPWGWLTYPMAAAFSDPFSIVLSGLWFYLAGGNLEIRWGRRDYAQVLLLAVPACSLPMLLGSVLLGKPLFLAGIWLPLACITVLWCLANPGGLVMLGFILPIPARIFLLLEYLLVYFYAAMSYGYLMGLFALGGPGLAYLYARRFGPDRKWLNAVRYSGRRKAGPERRSRLRRIK